MRKDDEGRERPLRVLHCPDIVAGNAQELARAEREIGLASWAIALQHNPYGYESDEFLTEEPSTSASRQLARFRLLWRALRDFDLIHFNFGQTILVNDWMRGGRTATGIRGLALRGVLRARKPFAYSDLALLRAAGKGLVVTFQGDDARQGDYARANFPITFANEVEPSYYTPKGDALKRHHIRQFARYADRMYAVNPDLLHVLPAGSRFLPYSHVDLRKWSVIAPSASRRPPIIVHAPTHRAVKGTRYLLEAVERLKAEGVPFELRLVEGLRRDEARRVYEQADLLVDQLLAGWYGGLAVELMALGKPVICYIRETDLHFLPREMRDDIPIIGATPSSIYDVLKEWLMRRADWEHVGMRSRAYVERWHDPIGIAKTVALDYRDVMSEKRSAS
jgi:glycosyltransferase involved in cell wall biosynthesis